MNRNKDSPTGRTDHNVIFRLRVVFLGFFGWLEVRIDGGLREGA